MRKIKNITQIIGIITLLCLIFLALTFIESNRIKYSILCGFALAIIKMIGRMSSGKKFKKELNKLNNFSPAKEMIGPWGLIAFDNQKKLIAVKESESSKEIKVYPYDKIFGCEIIVNDQRVFKRDLNSIISRSLWGNFLAGDTGAIIGGITTEQREEIQISSLEFKIFIKDFNKPYYFFRLYDAYKERNQEISKDDIIDYGIYSELLEKINDIKILIDLILDENKINNNIGHNYTGFSV